MDMKVKDFAASMGVTESIVYRHIRNHREELGDGVIKKPKATWLTDAAQELLRGLMVQPPAPVIGDAQTAQELAQAQAEINRLHGALEAALSESFALAKWKAEKSQAIAAAEQNQLLLDATKAELDQMKVDAAEAGKVRQDLEGQVEDLTGQLVQEREARCRAERSEAALRDYAAEVAAYNSLPWWQRLKAKKPVHPDL